MSKTGPPSTNGFAGRPALHLVLLTLGLIVLLVIAWLGRAIVMLFFAAVVLAVLLSALVDPLAARCRTRRSFAYALLLTTGVIVLGLTLWIVGPGIIEQFASLQTDLPQAALKLLDRLHAYPWGRWLLAQGSDFAQTSGNLNSAITRLGGFVLSTASLIAGLGLVLFLGLYLAAEPGMYLSGVRRLVPRHNRALFDACTRSAARVLRWWLISQTLSMLAVGLIVTAGLWALGVPLAGTLGIIAALLTFIPNIGPIVSVVPAALLAVAISPLKGLLVILLFLLVHFLEGNLITPLLERRIARLPPAVTLTAQLLLAVIAGPVGLALAAPLTAATLGVLQVLLPEEEPSPAPPNQ